MKGRFAPFLIGAVGLALGYLINAYHLHLQTAKQLAVIGFVSFGGSYAVWFLTALVVNTLRVPWLLDAESEQLIDEMDSKARAAETALAELKDNKEGTRRLHKEFGALMQSAAQLSSDLATCYEAIQFGSWDARLNQWLDTVKKAILGLGFDADAVAFIRAGDNASPVAGVVNPAYHQETRRRVLKQHEKELADIIRRRLP